MSKLWDRIEESVNKIQEAGEMPDTIVSNFTGYTELVRTMIDRLIYAPRPQSVDYLYIAGAGLRVVIDDEAPPGFTVYRHRNPVIDFDTKADAAPKDGTDTPSLIER